MGSESHHSKNHSNSRSRSKKNDNQKRNSPSNNRSRSREKQREKKTRFEKKPMESKWGEKIDLANDIPQQNYQNFDYFESGAI